MDPVQGNCVLSREGNWAGVLPSSNKKNNVRVTNRRSGGEKNWRLLVYAYTLKISTDRHYNSQAKDRMGNWKFFEHWYWRCKG